MELGNLSFDKVGKYLKSNKSIIIPIGSTEQHSRALPLFTDSLIAEKIVAKIAEEKKWIIGPTINIGYSDLPQPFMKFTGTITYKKSTLSLLISDYISSLHLHGFRNFYIVNTHGGNNKIIKEVVKKVRNEYLDSSFYIHNWWNLGKVQTFCKSIHDGSMNHAGTCEAALALYLFKDWVDSDKFTKEFNFTNTMSGVIDSDQTLATREMGERVFKMIIAETLTVFDNK